MALALERERLTAELLARRQELLESRSRLVQVADDERRRFAQDPHDLLQSRLVLATLRAGTLGSAPGLDPAIRHDADALRDDLTEAVRELRRLVHGVMPALLLERGLFAAAEDLLDRSPIPVDARWCGVLTELSRGRVHRGVLHPRGGDRERGQALPGVRDPGSGSSGQMMR